MKPGYKTTEFWLSVVITLLGYVNQSGILEHPLPVDTLMVVISPAITYILTRSPSKALAQFLNVKPVDPAKLNQ